MKKIILAAFSIVVLLFFTQVVWANVNLKGKYAGSPYQLKGKAIGLKKAGIYATEILVINNTPDFITVEVPSSGIYDWLNGNSVYRITSGFLFPTTNVRLWHPNYGYFDNYVSHYSIVSFSIQYGRATVIAVEYY